MLSARIKVAMLARKAIDFPLPHRSDQCANVNYDAFPVTAPCFTGIAGAARI